MTPISAFAAAVGTWQNFYLLVGTAAATLIGLMFVAVTFGAGLITAQSSTSARAFLDPPFTHFVTVLLAACLILVPTMTPLFLAILLLGIFGAWELMIWLALTRVRANEPPEAAPPCT